LDGAPGLAQDQIKARQQLKIFVQEQQAAIAHSEKALSDIDSILSILQKDKESTAKALSDWQAFLVQEKAEEAQAGGVNSYVAGKLLQVEGDESRPQNERLAYARRLEKLDPGNQEVAHYVRRLLGQEETPAPMPRPMTKRTRHKRKVVKKKS
jgi:predicted phage tail protein